jgi:hypothetical protein
VQWMTADVIHAAAFPEAHRNGPNARVAVWLRSASLVVTDRPQASKCAVGSNRLLGAHLEVAT